MMPINRHKPKPYIKTAIKRLGKLISIIKQDLSENDKVQLRSWYLTAYNCNDVVTLYKMIDLLNCRQYTTGSSFQLSTTFTHEHGSTLEVIENRF